MAITTLSFMLRPRESEGMRRRLLEDEAILRELLQDVQDPSNRYGRFGLLSLEEIGAIERLQARSRRAEAKEG